MSKPEGLTEDEERAFYASPCPYCTCLLTIRLEPNTPRPVPGDSRVCHICGLAAIYVDAPESGLALRMPTSEEVRVVQSRPNYPGIQELIRDEMTRISYTEHQHKLNAIMEQDEGEQA